MHDHFAHHLKDITMNDLEENGAVVGKLSGKKVAAYKDGNEVKAVSALCTHKFCVVEFDKDEKDWYCPCHGARFALGGEVINGPAVQPLPEVKVKVMNKELKLVE